MTPRSARLWLGSVLLTALLVSLAFASGTDAGSYLLLPGALVAWPVWPEGIHTRAGSASAMGFYLVYLIGNVAIWSIALRLILGLVFRPKGSHEPVQ